MKKTNDYIERDETIKTINKYRTKGNFCPNCGADMRGDKDE